MKITLPVLAVAAALSASSGLAIEYADFDLIPDGSVELGGGSAAAGQSYAGSFNLALSPGESDSAFMNGYASGNGLFSDLPGFVAPTDIETAEVSFWLSTVDGKFSVTISNGTLKDIFLGGGGPGSTEGHYQSTLLIGGDPEDPLTADLLLSIGQTGTLSYNIQETSGTAGFTVNAAMLKVTTATVPDGGATALLLGVGFFGLAGVRRFRK